METQKKQEEPVVKFFDGKKALGISFVRYSKKKQFIYGDQEGNLTLLVDQSDGKVAKKLKNHDSCITNIEWISEEQIASSGHQDIKITDFEKGKLLRELKGHTQPIYSLKVNSFRNVIASAGGDKMLLLWDIRTAKPFGALLAHSNVITSVDFSHDSSVIASTGADGYCRIWNVYDSKCQTTLMLENAPPISSGAFSPNSKFVLTSGLNSSIGLWELSTGKQINVYRGHSNENHMLPSFFLLREKDPLIISPDEEGKLFMWDMNSPSKPKASIVVDKIKAIKHMDICRPQDPNDQTEVAIACGGSRIAFLRI